MVRGRRLRSARRSGYQPTGVEITLTPLIDTVLVLLITFMITMPVMQNTLNVELPTGSANDSLAESKMRGVTVYIDGDNKLYINGKPAKNRETLMHELNKVLTEMHEEVVYVCADRRVLYENVAAVIDDIKYLGGVRYVALATKNG